MPINDAFPLLEKSIFTALETYANVHRGSGQKSVITTFLYEEARNIVLEYFGLNKKRYEVIFCSSRQATAIERKTGNSKCHKISGCEIGLPVGVTALAVKKRYLPRGIPGQQGGGTTVLVAPDWVVWADAPDRFEAGTPAIINVITLARALRLITEYGKDIFKTPAGNHATISEILYNDDFTDLQGKLLLEALRKTMIGRNIIVPVTSGTKNFINLDNAASTPSFLPVWNAVRLVLHQPEKIQLEVVTETKKICSGFLGAPQDTYDFIFTSNTTESINIAAESLAHEPDKNFEKVIVTSLSEHNSNDLPWRNIKHSSIIRLPVDAEGFINPGMLETLLCDYNEKKIHGDKKIVLVTICGASNVLGTFNDLEKISEIVHKYNTRLLVDAAQMVAHHKIEMGKLGIDCLAFSAHKAYAPFGTGVLVCKKGFLCFDDQEMSLIKSSGEKNRAGIAALGKTLLLLQRIGMDMIRNEMSDLTARALSGLREIPGITLYGINKTDSPSFSQKGGVIVFNLKDKFANIVARELAEKKGIGVRYGCHCAHLIIKNLVGVGPRLSRFQHIIATLFRSVKFPGLTRISIGIGNEPEDIEILLRSVAGIAGSSVIKKDTSLKPRIIQLAKKISEKVYTGS